MQNNSHPQAIKRLSLVRTRRDVPLDVCLEAWKGEHAAVLRGLPGILGYTVDTAREKRPTDGWDAIATVRFADELALRRFQDDPEVQDQLVSTRAGFAEAVEAFLVDEHVLIPQAAGR